MFSLLALSPYLLIPTVVTYIWCKYNLLNKWNNIVITVLAAALYSFFLKETAGGPPAESSITENEYRCGLAAFAEIVLFIFIRFFILVPASVLIQILFNFLFLSKRQAISTKESGNQTNSS